MTLMRFLAVGTSLGAAKNAQSRYRMNAENLLPKFGRKEKIAEEVALRPLSNPTPQAGVQSAGNFSSGAKVSEHSIAVQSQQRQPSGGAKSWNPWARLKDRFDSKRGAARAAGPPVQGEFALDMVRPVRNDLNDSDFEIVTTSEKARQKPAQAPPVTMVAMRPEGSGAKVLWGRVGRLFGVRQA